MTFKDILSISGYSGLYQFISQGRKGIIVEGLEDKKRMNAYTHYKVSTLNDIAIFSDSGEIPLKKVMKKIAEKHQNGQAISIKIKDAELKSYFAEILPDFDRERVYASDIKKVIVWYNLLQKLDLLAMLDEPDEEVAEEPKKEEVKEEKKVEKAEVKEEKAEPKKKAVKSKK
jgi:hypothetical protein